MLVYGDRSEEVDTRAFGRDLLQRCAAIAGLPSGLARHVALVGALIDAGRLAQGLADAAFERDGVDDGQELPPQMAAGVLAGAVGASWFGGFGAAIEPPQPLAARLESPAPDSVILRDPEGYAFYALYPEAVMEAAARLHRPGRAPAVVGLRSIGTSLAPVAACGAGGLPPVTLRPVGDPFARRLAVGRALRGPLLEAAETGGVLVVDEGPGASGSSFGAVGDWLEAGGVPASQAVYLPSHAGDLGPQASERHRVRWRTAKKAHASFEDVILPRLPGWVEPLIGLLKEPLRDLSGGLWREVVGDAPVWPQQERRKYLAVTGEGRFLLKFAGLGDTGSRKLERAKALHAAGFTPEPLGLAHGFLVERWVERLLSPPKVTDVEAVGAYLGWRARSLAPPHGAADDGLLRTMMTRNFGLAGLQELAGRAPALVAGDNGPPCAIDGRLHAWEWRRASGDRLLKLDAIDHCEAHDLVGAQDIAWDLAGAAIEFKLDPVAAERLRRIVEAEGGQALDPRRVMFQTLAYLAFQIGWWTFAADGAAASAAAAQARRYMERARAWRPDA